MIFSLNHLQTACELYDFNMDFHSFSMASNSYRHGCFCKFMYNLKESLPTLVLDIFIVLSNKMIRKQIFRVFETNLMR